MGHLPAPNIGHLPARLDRAKAVIVTDSNGQALAYVYFEDEPGRRRDEAR